MNIIAKSWPFMKKHSPLIVLHWFLGLATCTLAMLVPQVFQIIIDQAITPALGEPAVASKSIFAPFFTGLSPKDTLIRAIIMLEGMLFIRHAVLHYVRWSLAHYTGCACEKKLRVAVFNKIITQNTVVLNRYTSGELMSLANADANMVKDMYVFHFTALLENFYIIGVACFFLARINIYLLITPLMLGICMFVTARGYLKRMREVYNGIRTSSVELTTCVQENINGVRIVRGFASEPQEKEKFDKRNEKYRESFNTHRRVHNRYQVIFGAITQAAQFSAIILGVVLFFRSGLLPSEYAVFITYVMTIVGPSVAVANILAALQQCAVGSTRYFTFLETNNIIRDVADARHIEGPPHLRMNGVCLDIDEQHILTDIDLDLPYGKSLGVMGKTGAGKSALLKTMARFYETTRGETSINGIDIKRLYLNDVRLQFGPVMQDVFLFSNTVDANIAFFDPDTPKEEVVKAAKIAQADEFINKLSDGYETVVGEKGIGLSGGQKQRLSVARALLKDAPILMLDDATSALDLRTEQRLLSGIEENYPGKTRIIAAHRASSVMHCDEIIFLDGGRIVERGTFAELMECKGRYYDVYTAQSAAYGNSVA
ncbi:MAG: ABC transporter ATP-binding protein/permease [Firmicutes bacterium]|nr:ABC transporter ATP-binding protein/permease [Bacillota bacterium]